MEEIKLANLNKDLEEYQKDPKNTVVRHALSENSLSSISRTKDEIQDVNFDFDIDIKTMKVANQRASGRCWIFAATNVLREMMAKDLNLASFELSQSYIAFYLRWWSMGYVCEHRQ